MQTILQFVMCNNSSIERFRLSGGTIVIKPLIITPTVMNIVLHPAGHILGTCLTRGNYHTLTPLLYIFIRLEYNYLRRHISTFVMDEGLSTERLYFGGGFYSNTGGNGNLDKVAYYDGTGFRYWFHCIFIICLKLTNAASVLILPRWALSRFATTASPSTRLSTTR